MPAIFVEKMCYVKKFFKIGCVSLLVFAAAIALLAMIVDIFFSGEEQTPAPPAKVEWESPPAEKTYPDLVEEVSMPELLQHVRAGSLYYEEKNIKIRANVAYDASEMESLFSMKGRIALETYDQDVIFYVRKLKNSYKKGQAYTFTLYIESIFRQVPKFAIFGEDIQ